jgi:serine/threonine protein kinase
MTLPVGSHPSPERLDDFAAGRLGDAEFASVIHHISDCTECCARLESIPADPMVSKIRAAASSEGEGEEERRGAVQVIRDGLPRTRAAPIDNATLPDTAKIASDTSDPTRPPPAIEEPPPPHQVGAYEILGEVGRGGMGVVYRTRHIGLNRPAAVKMVLAGRLADKSDRLRLRLEAELSARIRHPNVVHVYDVGEYEGSPYLAMEWIAGGTLEDRLTDRPWAADDAARLVQTVAEAVQAAHEEGVIHRDLKPANILLDNGEIPAGGATATDSGSRPSAWPSMSHPKVADFGLARPLHGSGLTRSGFVAGTPAYMAPEQLTTGGAAVGPAVDVYALGVTLYRLLTGRLPFLGPGVLEVLAAASTREAPRPRRFNPAIPRDLESICLKCLEKRPHRRYASARASAEDLGRFLAGQPVAARRVGISTRTVRWCRRNPGTAGLVGALAAVALVGFGLITWKWLEADRLRVAAESERKEVGRQRDIANDHRRVAQRNLYRSNVRLAKQAVDVGRLEFARTLLHEAADGLPGDDDLRGLEWHYLQRLANPVAQTIARLPAEVDGAAVTRDGRLVACACTDGVVRVINTTDGREVFAIRTPDRTAALTFSGDGGRFAASLGAVVQVWDTRTWKPVNKSQPRGSFHLALRPGRAPARRFGHGVACRNLGRGRRPVDPLD